MPKMSIRKVVLILLGFLFGGICWDVSFVRAQPEYAEYNRLLRAYVDQQGQVAYEDLCSDDGLNQVTRMLSQVEPESLSKKDQLAFWVNAYNVFTLEVICNNYPVNSIGDLHRGGLILGYIFKTTIWDRKWFEINGQQMSLGYIEHKILRRDFSEPRIHFAIVCAAKSCPPLRREAYVGSQIEVQLDEQGEIFLAREDLNRFDVESRTIYLSKIFKWFKKDFHPKKECVLKYLIDYVPNEEIGLQLREGVGDWRVRWMKYNWALNEQTVEVEYGDNSME